MHSLKINVEDNVYSHLKFFLDGLNNYKFDREEANARYKYCYSNRLFAEKYNKYFKTSN